MKKSLLLEKTILEGEETGIIESTFYKLINNESSKKNNLFKLKKIVDAYKVKNLINKKNNFLF